MLPYFRSMEAFFKLSLPKDWQYELLSIGGNSPQNQKDFFCLPIVVLLPFKRTPFAHQKDSFCNPKGLLFKTTSKHRAICRRTVTYNNTFVFDLARYWFFNHLSILVKISAIFFASCQDILYICKTIKPMKSDI